MSKTDLQIILQSNLKKLKKKHFLLFLVLLIIQIILYLPSFPDAYQVIGLTVLEASHQF